MSKGVKFEMGDARPRTLRQRIADAWLDLVGGTCLRIVRQAGGVDEMLGVFSNMLIIRQGVPAKTAPEIARLMLHSAPVDIRGKGLEKWLAAQAADSAVVRDFVRATLEGSDLAARAQRRLQEHVDRLSAEIEAETGSLDPAELERRVMAVVQEVLAGTDISFKVSVQQPEDTRAETARVSGPKR